MSGIKSLSYVTGVTVFESPGTPTSYCKLGGPGADGVLDRYRFKFSRIVGLRRRSGGNSTTLVEPRNHI